MPDDIMVESVSSPALTPKPQVQTVPAGLDANAAQGVAETVFAVENLHFFYGASEVLRGTTMSVCQNQITAIIGPSGCGKSTLLRCFNRMNDLIPGARLEGTITYHDQDLYAPEVDPIEVRRRIGMVFQKPNPFPKSIYDNVAFGPKVNGTPRSQLNGIVEESLQRAALWDEVKDKLKQSALAL